MSIQILRFGADAKLPKPLIKVTLLELDAAINPVAGHTITQPLGQCVPGNPAISRQLFEGQVFKDDFLLGQLYLELPTHESDAMAPNRAVIGNNRRIAGGRSGADDPKAAADHKPLPPG
jgi:hypothetical protein